MVGITEQGNVVEKRLIGNTRAKICDDYCRKTQEEVDMILKRIAGRALEPLSRIPATPQCNK